METRRLLIFTFWPLLLIVSILMFILDYLNIVDTNLQNYAAVVILSIACSIFFASWWFSQGDATHIYKWLTFFFISISTSSAIQFIARLYWLHDRIQYLSFIESIIYQYRGVLEILSLVFMLSFIIAQRYGVNSLSILPSNMAVLEFRQNKRGDWTWEITTGSGEVLSHGTRRPARSNLIISKIHIIKQKPREAKIVAEFKEEKK